MIIKVGVDVQWGPLPPEKMVYKVATPLSIAGSSNGTVNVWDCAKQYCTHNFRGSKGIVHLVKFHPDQTVLKLFTSSADCNIRMWDLKTSK